MTWYGKSDQCFTCGGRYPDVMDARRTLEKMGVLHIMTVAKNEEEALQHLEKIERKILTPGLM